MADSSYNPQASQENDSAGQPERSERPQAVTTAVRYGRMNRVGEFTCPPNVKIPCGAPVIVATERGIELGQQLPLTCPDSPHCVSREQIRRYAKASGPDVYIFNNGRILRAATEGDLREARHLESGIPEKIETCQRMARELGLEMKVVDAEHIFGGERIVFYFMAEQRVDFRELVRRLAREFQTRIEMKQVGSRDEARLLADYETCGRECCCKNFLKTLKPVTMQMAKLQKATLDPTKVSGRCGRLKCCLRYEHDTYEELSKRLPRVGRRVATRKEVGRVVDRQVLTQLVRIRTDEGKIVTIAVEDIVQWDVPEPPPPRPEESADRPLPAGRREPPRPSGQGRGMTGRETIGEARAGRWASEPPQTRPAPERPSQPLRGNAGREGFGDDATDKMQGDLEREGTEEQAASQDAGPAGADSSASETQTDSRRPRGRRRGRRRRGGPRRDGGGERPPGDTSPQ